jgi:drug/metabolite transporter (DMT)-like permease
MEYFFAGFTAAVLGSILFGLRELLEKYLTKTKKLASLTVLICQAFFLISFLLILGLVTKQLNDNLTTIGIALIGSAVLGLGLFLHLRAISIEDFSLTLPFLSFTPIFLIPLEFIFFKALPSGAALVGIIAIIIGTLWLGYLESKEKNLKWHLSKGSRLMLLVALIYSLAGNIDKMGSLSSSPLNYLFWLYLFMTLIYLAIYFQYQNKKKITSRLSAVIKNYWPWFLLVGLIVCLASWLMLNAYLTMLVNYAISIKRAGFLIPILLGPILFKEKKLSKRLPGILLMLGGAIIIIIFG